MSAETEIRETDRERQSRLEIGQTEISRGPRLLLITVFLATIFSVPLIQQLHELKRIRSTGEGAHSSAAIFGSAATAAKDLFREGDGNIAGRVLRVNRQFLRDINDYESNLSAQSFLTHSLVPPVQQVLTGWLGAGTESVYPGREDWLFYRPAYDHATGAGFLDIDRTTARLRGGDAWQPAPVPDPLIAIFHMNKELTSRGIRLVIVPVPGKITIHPELFSGERADGAAPLRNRSYSRFLSELKDPTLFFYRYDQLLAAHRDTAADHAAKAWFAPLLQAYNKLLPSKQLLIENPVLLFDSATMLVERKRSTGDQQYLRDDTHWRPEAMQATADGVAALVRASAPMPAIAAPQYSRLEMAITNTGDLAAMMDLPDSQALYPPESVTIKQVTQGKSLWRADRNADVLVLGDSFCNVYSLREMGWGESAGFVEQLSVALQRPVDAILQNAAGALSTRKLLSRDLSRGVDRLAGKRVVVWEFAARELSVGDWRIDTTPLALGTPRESDFVDIKEGESVVVSGIIREIAAAPRPGAVTYADHVVYAHLTDLESSAGELPGSEAYVAMLSMRDRVWTAAARYRVGQRVELRLRNFDEVNAEHRVGRINSEMLDGDVALEAPCWGEDPAVSTHKLLQARPTEVVAPVMAQPDVPVVGEVAGIGEAAFRDVCQRQAEQAGDALQVTGLDGWFFLRSELRHLGVGEFWGDKAASVSMASRPDRRDPLPAIIDFSEQLKTLGIELILMPVPPKALVYPEKLPGIGETEFSAARAYSVYRDFYSELQTSGVHVVDLLPLLVSQKAQSAHPLYCKTDSHWSGTACVTVAKSLAEEIRKHLDTAPTPLVCASRDVEVTIHGDLAPTTSETLPLRFVETQAGTGLRHVVPDPKSPVLLVADSHGLVFHAGDDMHTTGAGLFDQLALELKLAPDLIAVRGSAATPARIDLYRRAKADPSYLAAKKVIVWFFAAREFTESSGWAKVPVVR